MPYAIVKNVGEAYLRSFKREYDLDFTIFRLFNTYGPKQSTDFVISKFLNAALKDKDITIYGDGSQTRTFCYIEDHLDATCNAFYNNLMVNDVANIGTDQEVTVLELAKIIIKVTNSRSSIVHMPSLKEGDMSRRKPDVTQMKELLKRDFMSLEEGLKIIIRNNHFVLS